MNRRLRGKKEEIVASEEREYSFCFSFIVCIYSLSMISSDQHETSAGHKTRGQRVSLFLVSHSIHRRPFFLCPLIVRQSAEKKATRMFSSAAAD